MIVIKGLKNGYDETQVQPNGQDQGRKLGGMRLHQSEKGSQYTGKPFLPVLADNGIICSMSWASNSWDNSA